MFRQPLLFFTLAAVAHAQGLDYIKAQYTKYEYRIPMRDGKRLFTAVYIPKDDSKSYPILLNRTPYSVSPYGPDKYKADIGPSNLFAKEGFIFAYQDVRGRHLSEGEFINMTPHKPVKRGPADVDESTDTYDTIDWLVKRVPNNNGRVGTWGISYPGFYASAGMIDAHPAHKAASPQAPIADWFIGDDFHRNGAFYLAHAFNFFARFGRPRPEPAEPPANVPRFDHGTPDGYDFFLRLGPLVNANEKHFKNEVAFWNDMMKHGTYDEFWQSRNLRPHLKGIRPAVMTVGGWFDTENLFGALETYRSVEKQSAGAYNILVMGPWWHGGWSRSDGDAMGHIRFHFKTAEWYRENVELPFFRYFLKEHGEKDKDGKPHPPPARLAEAVVFETGSNLWRRHDTWPPNSARPRNFYLSSGGRLEGAEPAATVAFDEYLSDPNKPVPYSADISTAMTREHMLDDQRFAASRPDVLVYQTGPLEEDVVVAGPIRACLFVSTTGTDSDWIVKLIDVYPDRYDDPPAGDGDPPARTVKMGGFQQLVRGEVFRGKFRNSFQKPEPFAPGQLAKVEYALNDIYHNFRRGHRIMVQIQSSWFPIVDRNPQKFVDIYHASEADFQKATQRVYRQRGAASHIQLLVME